MKTLPLCIRRCFVVCVFCLGTGVMGETVSTIPENLPDIKPMVLHMYGVREAGALDATHIRVILGAATTDISGLTEAWRIQSEDDPAYAYELFVQPTAVDVAAESGTEFVAPPDFSAPDAARITEFQKWVVDLSLPTPLVSGCTYSVVGIGRVSDGRMVTAGKTAATFRYEPEQGAFEPDPALTELAASVYGLRALRYLGDSILEAEFGAGFNEGLSCHAEAFRVRVNLSTCPVLATGRRSVIDVYHPEGWPYKVYRHHRVFLKLARPLQNGDIISLQVPSLLTCGATTASMKLSDRTSLAPSIKINQAGYLPGEVKQARAGYWLGSYPENEFRFYTDPDWRDPTLIFLSSKPIAPPSPPAPAPDPEAVAAYRTEEQYIGSLGFDAPPVFEIRDAATHETVWSGTGTFRVSAQEWDAPRRAKRLSGENVFELDFTEFRTPGRYYLAIPNLGRSFDFSIQEDVYREPFEVASYGLFAQRCGQELAQPHSPWRRIACHTNGVLATSCQRLDYDEWGAFTENLIYTTEFVSENELANELLLQGNLTTARQRPSLFAYFPFDGTGENAIPDSFALTPRGTPVFELNGTVVDDPEASVYAADSPATNTNGWTGTFAADPTQGLTLTYWMVREDIEGKHYNGDMIRLRTSPYMATWKGEGNVGIQANWGMLQQIPNSHDAWDRVGDKRWRSYAIVIPPIPEDGSTRRVQARFYCDAQEIFQPSTFEWPTDCSQFALSFACVIEEHAIGCRFDELRLFNEALPVSVLTDLAKVGNGATSAPHPKRLHAIGGHHDAGDFNPRSHMDVAYTLLNAYELYPQNYYDGQLNIPENANHIPDILDEALWAIQLWHGLYDDATGAVCNGTESQGDPNFVQTVELDNKGDYAWAPDSQGAFKYAAACAWAARLLSPFDTSALALQPEELIRRARKAYAWGVANPIQTDDTFAYNTYYRDPMAHAAAELLHTTGDATYATDFESIVPWVTAPNTELIVHRTHDLSSAAFAYLALPSALANPTLRAAIYNCAKHTADDYTRKDQYMGYPHIVHAWAPITWGTGAHPNYLMPVLNLSVYASNPADRAYYRQWMVWTADNSLGRNPLGLCWTVGIGPRTVRAPLHNSRYSAAGLPAPGMQAQGPNLDGNAYQYNNTCYPARQHDYAILQTFVDAFWAIAMDEGTVNNQAFTVALFGTLLPPHEVTP